MAWDDRHLTGRSADLHAKYMKSRKLQERRQELLSPRPAVPRGTSCPPDFSPPLSEPLATPEGMSPQLLHAICGVA